MKQGPPHTASQVRDVAVRELLTAGEQARLELPQQLRHRIAFADPSLFNDEVIARSRGLLVHLTEQLAGGRLPDVCTSSFLEGRDDILHALLAEPRLLSFCHALSFEYQLTRHLAETADLDPLLPPLMQVLIASPDAATSHLAATCLAAQTQHLRSMERMQLPLRQLPADLLHITLNIARKRLKNSIVAEAVEQAVRSTYDEGLTRQSRFSRLTTAPDFPNKRGWHLDKAGVPLFLTVLAMRSGTDFADAALLMSKGQMVRLALSLKSLGCPFKALQRNLFLLHDEEALPVLASVTSAATDDMLTTLVGSSGRGAAA